MPVRVRARRSALAASAPKVLTTHWLLGATLLLNGGCHASDQASLQWPVAAPPPIQARDPVLWVALAARLGPVAPAAAEGAAPLRLRAASGSLTLMDGAGQRISAPEVTLRWRWDSLPRPFHLRRRVLGPFASHESAEAAARPWVEAGLHPVIAKPSEWEVWAPAEAPDPPGRTARLLERREERRLVLVAEGPKGALVWRSPVQVQAPGGLRWGTGTFRGPFRLLPDAHGGWSLVEEAPLERYLEGVVPHEIGAGSPPAALAVQAVLARTWALRNRERFQADGYHLCADTQCQVYSDPSEASASVREAIAASRGQVLAVEGQPIHAVYHASNGGVAAGLEEAWNVNPAPYLRPFADGDSAFVSRTPLPVEGATLSALLRQGAGAYGVDHPLFRWQRTLTARGVESALAARGLSVGAPRGLKVVERGASGRVLALKIVGAKTSLVLRRDSIRRALRDLPSTLFTVSNPQPGVWLVRGGGFGHGVGLSQAGAIDLARRGWSLPQILQHYYPGTDLKPIGALVASPSAPPSAPPAVTP
ncbi:MAG: SpoIID/LytB domain-containing protein [Cyanobacteriota bacterium]|nr:SpoIID/LytB domain-containing protein [Cyanobacteriota bacterium]